MTDRVVNACKLTTWMLRQDDQEFVTSLADTEG